MNQIYLDTARLLTPVAPQVFVDDMFALKGGTAINLFVRDMPRLSVDLDLVFADHTLPRDAALARINEAVRQSAERLKKRGFQTHAPMAAAGETKLLVRRGSVQVKVEVNFVMRGTVRPVRKASLTPTARDVLMADLEIPVVSLEDVYGGKPVAALDRQHPRDLFDVMQLFAHEGITPGIRRAFVVYLASSNRPVNEVLFPPLRDIRHDFEHNFQGMTAEPVPLESLLAARERLLLEVQRGLDEGERRFLLSLVAGTPEWALLDVANLEHLPGVRWKLQNLAQLQKTNPKKFAEQADLLAARLSGLGS
ncbi:nucleotidyl transferase AbiEii/AbiGii toxin family protein [Variovorax ginsengisoli]|uniref:Nucleotidyl transferase AbiEii/AbiGii toxin family protein n=1 Tax=Variovorax ginsengisoli TaxID=363844 RepID=A0ABT8S7N3_9BURK|nr:nucleotidyl transferase AbiEii/AbiGii toxin family protein [Variovorax ginsengisoli]MDN8615754.1 nucleotidyl transferase AbiEii/AbiGii toxin family protein [Variovorax ginsengisoli]MDO1534924.1 nucleotidyl transferase AbiEii/AbiGii toxin family protein [Variovorax ginsengisoli]